MSDKNKKLADSIVDELLSGSSAKERPEEKDLSSDIVNELLGGDVMSYFCFISCWVNIINTSVINNFSISLII